MADKKIDEALGQQFCEYQYLSGEWVLVNSHTHEGYYCSYYEEGVINSEGDPPEKGDVESQLEKPAFPSAHVSNGHRRYGIYKLEVDAKDTVTVLPTHQWSTSTQDIFPQDLFAELATMHHDMVVEALKAAAISANEISLALEVAISEDDIRGVSVHVTNTQLDFNPDHAFCVYECHEINGRWTYVPVVGSCLASTSEVSTDYFPTDLIAYMKVHGPHDQMRKYQEIGESYKGKTGCDLRIVISAKSLSHCRHQDDHLPRHGDGV